MLGGLMTTFVVYQGHAMPQLTSFLGVHYGPAAWIRGIPGLPNEILQPGLPGIRMTSRTGRTGSDEPVEDRDLVRRCLEGDQGAYRLLLARYERAVYGLVRRMIADPEEAR